jgi:hypothetical protein
MDRGRLGDDLAPGQSRGLIMAANVPEPMSSGLRRALMWTFGLLWASGCGWLVLHYFFGSVTEFGPAPSPWAPVLLRIHGWLAVGGVYLLGWVTAGHVRERWQRLVKRTSGIAMAGLALVLVVTGYALYYTTDRLHDGAGFVHEVLGAAGILFALTHWRRFRVARRSRLLPG